MHPKLLKLCVAALLVCGMAAAQQPVTQSSMDELLQRLAAQDARIAQLEQKLLALSGTAVVAAPVAAPAPETPAPPPPAAEPTTTETAADTPPPDDPHDHMINLPGGGPVLKIRGFFDFNYGVGSVANPLVFPVADNGCGTCGNPVLPTHNAFQAGEFDLFMTSQLSEHLSFLAEMVLGPDDTNVFGLDIERYQLAYKVNRYFTANAGRFHTSIGYYNTAYHHGNWFATAEGRPIMFLFEDSGGILPVHMVGLNFTGEVPHTEALGLHWVAELGNGNSSNPAAIAIQNFYSDRNYKATNFAVYIRPRFASGLQIGGSWFHDGLNPAQAEIPLAVPELKQNIESAYLVYLTSKWEFLNEFVVMDNHPTGSAAAVSPMAYTQIARGFGIYKPYFRYQYVDDSRRDPINLLRGIYYGPSVGMRIDFTDYAAFKLQFNHLYESSQLAGNGLDAQVAFTF
jgi:hypothetical protein